MGSRMKILHILDHSLPLHSGYAFRSQNILLSQFRRGWRPAVLTSPKHEESLGSSRKEEESFGGFRYYRTGSLSQLRLPLVRELRLMAALAKRLDEVVRLEKPDILHAHSPALNVLPALWISRKFGIPVVYEIRAFWEDAAVDHGTYKEKSWKYRTVRFLETWACKRVDQVAVICCGLKDDLAERGISLEKIAVVFNGINVDYFKTCEPDQEYRDAWGLGGKKIIGFIGSFYRYEGLDLLVKAFKNIACSNPNVCLLLVGGGEMEEELRVQVKGLRLEDRVIMPGRIDHNRVPGIYALTNILVYPRYSIRLTELVTPLKPLEAMAMGKALVASDIGGHRELIRHGQTGLLFRPGDVLALSDALRRLLNDDGLRQYLQTQGSIWVREAHTWDKTTEVYEEFYDRALWKIEKS